MPGIFPDPVRGIHRARAVADAGRGRRRPERPARPGVAPGCRSRRARTRRGAQTPAAAGSADGIDPTTKELPMATTRSAAQGILADDNTAKREQIVELLKKAYWMEIETVMSYIANSINPDGVRAQEIIESLQEDIQEELGHAQQFAARIKELYGVVPGSMEFTAEQGYLQPPEHQTDIVHVIKGVIEAETGAIEHYNRDHRGDRGRRPGHQRHGHRHPPRRGGPPPAVRGLPARVRGARAWPSPGPRAGAGGSDSASGARGSTVRLGRRLGRHRRALTGSSGDGGRDRAPPARSAPRAPRGTAGVTGSAGCGTSRTGRRSCPAGLPQRPSRSKPVQRSSSIEPKHRRARPRRAAPRSEKPPVSTASVSTPARPGRLAVPGRVADHDRRRRRRAFSSAARTRSGSGLVALDVGRRRPAVGQLARVEQVEVVVDLVGLAPRGEHDLAAAVPEVLDQLARARAAARPRR